MVLGWGVGAERVIAPRNEFRNGHYANVFLLIGILSAGAARSLRRTCGSAGTPWDPRRSRSSLRRPRRSARHGFFHADHLPPHQHRFRQLDCALRGAQAFAIYHMRDTAAGAEFLASAVAPQADVTSALNDASMETQLAVRTFGLWRSSRARPSSMRKTPARPRCPPTKPAPPPSAAPARCRRCNKPCRPFATRRTTSQKS